MVSIQHWPCDSNSVNIYLTRRLKTKGISLVVKCMPLLLRSCIVFPARDGRSGKLLHYPTSTLVEWSFPVSLSVNCTPLFDVDSNKNPNRKCLPAHSPYFLALKLTQAKTNSHRKRIQSLRHGIQVLPLQLSVEPLQWNCIVNHRVSRGLGALPCLYTQFLHYDLN